MKVILMEQYRDLGDRGKVVEVKDGFARNFLFPRGIALEATDGNMKVYAEEDKRRARLDAKSKAAAVELKKELQKLSVTIKVEAKDDEELFGSIGAAEISAALAKEKHAIDKGQVILDEPIKKLGVYSVAVKLHADVQADIKVWVVKK